MLVAPIPLGTPPHARRLKQRNTIKFCPCLQVMSMLGIQGKQVGKVRDQLADWQLANPGASAQECKEWLEASKETVLAQAKAALDT